MLILDTETQSNTNLIQKDAHHKGTTKGPNKDVYDVFISHSSKDLEVALELLVKLEASGLKCWISHNNIHGGDDYGDKILETLEKSRALVLLLTENSINSRYVRNEVEIAVADKKTIIPFIISASLKPELTGRIRLQLIAIQYNIMNAMKVADFDILAKSITSPDKPQPGNLPSEPKTPERTKKSFPGHVKSVLIGISLFLTISAIAIFSINRPTPTHTNRPQLATPFTSDIIDAPDLPIFVDIAGGIFTIGDSSGDLNDKLSDDAPKENVLVESFGISENEITVLQFNRFLMDNNESQINTNNEQYNHPVTNVSWFMANAYAQWLSKPFNGETFRLPTEAEWEYAARASPEYPTKYHYGDSLTENDANFAHSNREDGLRTTKVGSFPPNRFGLYDIHGNVSEWTCSAYSSSYDGGEKKCLDSSALHSSTDIFVSIRGGAWNDAIENIRSSYRSYNHPYYKDLNLGFRVVRENNK